MPCQPADPAVRTQVPRRRSLVRPRDEVAVRVETLERQARLLATSGRAFARCLDLAPSTVNGWVARKAAREDPVAEVVFFESPEGIRFLHRLQVALHLVIPEVCGGGLRPVRLVLRLAGLSPWIACSYGARRRFATRMEARIVAYGNEERQRLAEQMPERTVVLAEDETFHPAMCLVGMDTVSGYIFVETYASARDAKTWTQETAKGLAGLKVKVAMGTTDGARGLKLHVREALGAHTSPDVFHVQYDVSRATTCVLGHQVRAAEDEVCEARTRRAQVATERDEAEEVPRRPGRPIDYDRRLEKAAEAEEAAAGRLNQARERQEAMRTANRAISLSYHPYELTSGASRPAERVREDLKDAFATIWQLAGEADLPERCLKKIAKAERVVLAMVATIAFVHDWIAGRTGALAIPEAVRHLLRTVLIPGLYLARVAARTKGAEAREALRDRSNLLLATLRSASSPWTTLSPALQQSLWNVAQECADLFQRSSSCVEGRNGQLALHHHHLHRLSATKLAVLTIIHNYFLVRPDGTTAAGRFFGTTPRDLFGVLCDTLPLPARPRFGNKRAAEPPLQAAA